MGRTVSIRESLTRDLVIVIILFSGLTLAVMAWATRRAVRTLSSSLTRSTIHVTDQRLRRFFEPVDQQLRLISAQGQAGLLDIDDPDSIRALVMPVIKHVGQVSAIEIADERGHEYMLLRVGDEWRQRETRVEEWGGQSRWTEWETAGGPNRRRDEKLGYDPRKRPWFTGAVEMLRQANKETQHPLGVEVVHWTEPYTFFTTKEPGITASAAYVGQDGMVHVVGLDISLTEISSFTMGLKVGETGQAIVLSDDWRVIGLPRDPQFASAEARRASLLQPPEELDWPLGQDARLALEPNRAGVADQPQRFESGGEIWWADLQPFVLNADHSLWMGVLVPEREMLRDLVQIRVWIGGIALVILVGSVWRGLVLARRFSRPIEALAEQTDRFARGDLEASMEVVTPVREVRTLALAHERMRQALVTLIKMESDLRVARQIQEGTLPKQIAQVNGYEIGAWSEPADETGGDVYDVFGYRRLPGEDGVVEEVDGEAQGAVLMVADATGHGIGPALSAAQIRAMLRMAVRVGAEPTAVVRHMNEQLYADLPPGRFITVWVALIDSESNTVESFSAGQGPIIVYRVSEDVFEVQGADEPPMGVLRDLHPEAFESTTLEPGDLLIVVSDGIIEAENEERKQFGLDRLKEVLRAERLSSPDQIIQATREAVAAFVGTRAPSDDRTAIIIRRTGA